VIESKLYKLIERIFSGEGFQWIIIAKGISYGKPEPIIIKLIRDQNIYFDAVNYLIDEFAIDPDLAQDLYLKYFNKHLPQNIKDTKPAFEKAYQERLAEYNTVEAKKEKIMKENLMKIGSAMDYPQKFAMKLAVNSNYGSLFKEM